MLAGSGILASIGPDTILGRVSIQVRAANSYLTYWKHRVRLSLAGSNAAAVEQSSAAQSVPVLLYHGINNGSDGTSLSEDRFSEHALALRTAGYSPIGIDDFTGFITGKRALRDKAFLLTFDDGRTDSFYEVDPWLKALNWRAVMFVITSQANQRRAPGSFYLSAEELAAVIRTGRWDIQSHGHLSHDPLSTGPYGKQGHFLSNKLWQPDSSHQEETDDEFARRIADDLATARGVLRDQFSVEARTFSFPFGDFGQGSLNCPSCATMIAPSVRQTYDLAFYQTWPGEGFSFNAPSPDAFLVKRITVSPQWTGPDLVRILERGRPKALPWSEAASRDSGWIAAWGDVGVVDHTIHIGTGSVRTGSLAFLEGSSAWQDYSADAVVMGHHTSSLGLLVRFKNPTTYVACAIRPAVLQLSEVRHGSVFVIAKRTELGLSPNERHRLSVVVAGAHAACSVDGGPQIDGAISDDLIRGGIGIQTWAPDGAPQADIATFTVVTSPGR